MNSDTSILSYIACLFIAIGLWVTPILVPLRTMGTLTYVCGQYKEDIVETNQTMDLYIRNDPGTIVRWYGIANGCFLFNIKSNSTCDIIVYADGDRKYLVSNSSSVCLMKVESIASHFICDNGDDTIFWSTGANRFIFNPIPLRNASMFACPSHPYLCTIDVISTGQYHMLSDNCGTRIFRKV